MIVRRTLPDIRHSVLLLIFLYISGPHPSQSQSRLYIITNLPLPYSLLLVMVDGCPATSDAFSTLLKSQNFRRMAGNVFYALEEPGKFGVPYRVLWITGTGQS